VATDFTKDADCVGAWLLDESSGDAIDASSEGNDGTVSGATQGATGQYGTAYDFESASDDRITIGDVTILDSATAISMVAWVNIDSLTNSVMVVDKWDESNASEKSYFFRIQSDGDIQGAILTGPAANINFSIHSSSTPNVGTGSFTHVAAIWGGGTTWTFYVDGVDAGDITLIDNGTTTSPQNVTEPLKIGIGENAGFRNEFEGRIDEVGLFTRTLSSDEVNEIKDNGIDGKQAAFMTTNRGYWGV